MRKVLKAKVGHTEIELVQGDITKQDVDAIVNAANSSLVGGGGVDGAIHRAAGSELLAECKTLGGCPTGEARISKGYKLAAKHVIHTVGPIYSQHQQPEVLLANAHRNSLKLLEENKLTSIAFPAISTGIYGYPMREAALVALQTVIEYIQTHQTQIELVRFVLFSADALEIFSQTLGQLVDEINNPKQT